MTITIDGGIGAATEEFISTAITEAEEKHTEALIIKLNTPGGYVNSTRGIVSSILNSEIPVVVYVSPSGAHAGSAGMFITITADIAAMADGTNMGSAHPVGMGGESGDSSDFMTQKVTNDAAAWARSIAEKRGRNKQWAEAATRQSISNSAKELLDSNVIDIIAPNMDSLIRSLNGWQVIKGSNTYTLNTDNITIIERNKDWKEELLSVISDPNIAYIFILITIAGFYLEIKAPGSVIPGVVGAISAVLAAYSLQMLPVNYLGLILIALSFIMFLLEVWVTSYGILSIGGILSFFLGSIMLIDSPSEIMDISYSLIITTTICIAFLFGFVIYFGTKSQFRKNATGLDSMIDKTAVCCKDIEPNSFGEVKINGERWQAASATSIKQNERVKVLSVKGLKLTVIKL
ncbi:nodulation protein NfeD [Candidatus Kapabacteria bacterium]|nr:nodulation protein NfeD [Candidatus Kapabacteria bacterium]